MKTLGNIKLYTFDEVKDELIGKAGTPERNAYENEVSEALHAYRIGEAVKKARLMQNLTQEELGERVGVRKAQISRIEKGYSISIPTMSRVFKALGIATATLDLGIAGKVALW
ncbi:MAG: helix-turn-helix transcriptional regulator [Prevotellaceae bacterium]|nr:helix-turn-helix domain-containing protein [Prevotella sp.]MDD7272842.1 helix-turn-helix transcriptional regulator [Prevotellaceae bacterium]